MYYWNSTISHKLFHKLCQPQSECPFRVFYTPDQLIRFNDTVMQVSFYFWSVQYQPIISKPLNQWLPILKILQHIHSELMIHFGRNKAMKNKGSLIQFKSLRGRFGELLQLYGSYCKQLKSWDMRGLWYHPIPSALHPHLKIKTSIIWLKSETLEFFREDIIHHTANLSSMLEL